MIPWSCEKKEVPFPSKPRPCKLCYPDPAQIDPVKIPISRSCPNKSREILSNPVISQPRAVQNRRNIDIPNPVQNRPAFWKRTGFLHISMTSSGSADNYEIQCRMYSWVRFMAGARFFFFVHASFSWCVLFFPQHIAY